jgi:RNA polymerase sigma-70 factor (ECF subfamily)
MRLGERGLAEEVLQDVMLAVWRSAGQFRGESKVLTWLLTIARNRAINTRRKQTPILVTLHEALDTGDTGPLEHVMRQNEQRVVRDALFRLPEPQREILVLAFYHQLAEAEIAAVLGIATGTVKSRLHRAKAMLRRVLHNEGQLYA